MKRCHELGCHTFASVEPIVDIANSEWAMSDAYPYCELFKVGLMSGGAKPDKYAFSSYSVESYDQTNKVVSACSLNNVLALFNRSFA